MTNNNLNLVKKIIWLRIAQMIINEYYKKGVFKVPIHLAMGHEAIAIAVDNAMSKDDSLFVTHRNIHYNLSRQGTLIEELNEYFLKPEGLAQGRLGSMNLNNPSKGVIYASSILGNDMPVASGYALGNKLKKNGGVTFISTGDGAIEEGAFYESLLFLKSYNLAGIIIIENNEWSLATRINERRTSINIEKLVSGLGIEYFFLESNDIFDYSEKLEVIKNHSIESQSPKVVEVKLTTLGYWYMTNEQHPKGKFINYHSGPALEIIQSKMNVYPVLDNSVADPLYVLNEHLSTQKLVDISNEMLSNLKVEIR